MLVKGKWIFIGLLCLISSMTSTVVLSSEGDTYDFAWLDPDKEVYVLQNRKYRKDGKFHFNIGYGLTTSGAFVDASAIQGRGSYFFTEELGLELVYSKNSGEENAAAKSVRNAGGTGSRPFRRIVQNYLGIMGMWAPFYSKINTFDSIVYIDWMFGLGYGKIEESNNRSEFDTQTNLSETIESHNGLIWTVASKIYLSEMLSLRIDLTALHYRALAAKQGTQEEIWYTNYDATASLGISF